MTSSSSQYFSRAQKVIPGGVNSPVRAFKNVHREPFYVDRAEGARIWDVEGNEMIDYVGTWGPAILGHCPEVVQSAVKKALKKGTSFGMPHALEVEMAECICNWVPSIEKVRMVNSGTEATMSAIRLARGFTKRDKIVKFSGCYHGHVDGLLVAAGSGAITFGQADSAGVPQAYAEQTIVLPFNDPEAVENLFLHHGEKIAAVILEPLPANAGLILPEENYLSFLRKVTQKYGALLIFDEVMTGFRVAKGGMQELTKITPDLTALGKVIGGGLPVGAFGGRADIMQLLAPEGPVYQAGTLSGNPLALAAGLAQLQELERVNGWAQLEEKGKQLESGFRNVLEKKSTPYVFHRLGSMFWLGFLNTPVQRMEDVEKSDPTFFAKFFNAALKKGIFFAPSLYEVGFISLAHSEQDIEKTIQTINEIL